MDLIVLGSISNAQSVEPELGEIGSVKAMIVQFSTNKSEIDGTGDRNENI
jgi:hypothetical protein